MRVFNGIVDIGADEAVIQAVSIKPDPGPTLTGEVPVDLEYVLLGTTDVMGGNWIPQSPTLTAMQPTVSHQPTPTQPMMIYRLLRLGP